MPKIVNDYPGLPGKNKKDSKPTKETILQPQDKSLPEPSGSDSPGAGAHDCKESASIPAVDNSSFERLFEQNIFGVECELPNDVRSDVSPPQSILDHQPETAALGLDPTYVDLIKETRRDQVTLSEEDVDHDLVGVLAKNLNSRDQFSAPEEETPQAGLSQDQDIHLYLSQEKKNPGFWTRAAMPGSAMVLGVVLVTGVFLKSTPSIDEKKIAEASLVGEQKSSEALSMAEFVPPPSLREVNELAKRQDDVVNDSPTQASDRQLDVERTMKLDNLNAKLKIVRVYQSSRQRAFNVAVPEKKPDLLEEVTKIQAETSSLEEKIAALQPPQSVVQTLEADETAIATKVIPKITAGTGTGEARDDIKSTKAVAATLPTNPKTRNPETVELAMASMPGLYLLEPFKRSRLKAKLVDGECLVPALSSVFPQVPALVMRDMVRQFEGQC